MNLIQLVSSKPWFLLGAALLIVFAVLLIRSKNISAQIHRLHKQKSFRPTVSAIIQHGNGDFLLVESAKSPYGVNPPQGGIEEGEKPKDALKRELTEELNHEFRS